jgi:hypothetical protein
LHWFNGGVSGVKLRPVSFEDLRGAMTYMDQSIAVLAATQDGGALSGQAGREPIVLVVEDDEEYSTALRAVCDCLDVVVERMPSRDDLGSLLTERRPMAVSAAMDGAGQDGCHVLMTVATYDRDLPVLLISNDDPALLGAIEAVEEVWQLTSVVKWPRLLGIGAVVDFLFRAGRKGNCMRLMPL